MNWAPTHASEQAIAPQPEEGAPWRVAEMALKRPTMAALQSCSPMRADEDGSAPATPALCKPPQRFSNWSAADATSYQPGSTVSVWCSSLIRDDGSSTCTTGMAVPS